MEKLEYGKLLSIHISCCNHNNKFEKKNITINYNKMINSIPKNITIKGITFNVKNVMCYLAILYLMSIFYRCIKRSEFSVVGGNQKKNDMSCYGQPENIRGNLPGAYSNIPRDVNDKFFNRFNRVEEDERRF